MLTATICGLCGLFPILLFSALPTSVHVKLAPKVYDNDDNVETANRCACDCDPYSSEPSCTSSYRVFNGCHHQQTCHHDIDEQWAKRQKDAPDQLTSVDNRHSRDGPTTAYCRYRCLMAAGSGCTSGPSFRLHGDYTDEVVAGTEIASSDTSHAVVADSTYNVASCENPDGKSCDWYINCLEAKYHCRGTSADYAVGFAYRYCTRYYDNYHRFSSIGQQWIDSVCKCLQVCLAPFLRRAFPPTCSEIKSRAIQTHASCYLNMGCHVTSSSSSQESPGNVSFCDLPLSDVVLVAYVVWPSLIDPANGVDTWSVLFEILRECFGSNWFG